MSHRWKFERAGGVDQVVLTSGADIKQLSELDRKLWIALSMPTRGVDVEARTLELLDSDKDGQVRAPEILEAVAWLDARLDDLERLYRGEASVPQEAIRDADLRKTAREVAGKDGVAVALADVSKAIAALDKRPQNGDGVVTADSTDDAELARIIGEAVASVGGVPDRSGKSGLDEAKSKAFFAGVAEVNAWQTARPAGDALAPAWAAVQAVRAKVEDYFARCRLAAFDPKAAAALGPSEADLGALGARELGPTSPELEKLPLARIEAGRALPLEGAVNPAWAGRLGELARTATPLLGARSALSEADWRELDKKLAPQAAWQAARPATPVATMADAAARARAIADGDFEPRIARLISEDLAAKTERDRLVELEKLTRLGRDFVRILRNYVSFDDFYRKRDAVFQAGTLYLDGRACSLVVEVTDGGKHATLAPMAATYLAYCDCTRAGGEKKQIAAAFTAGDSDNLFVGRNGVYWDRAGKDWQASITKIIEAPISVRQAFWSPYKKLARMIEGAIQRRAASADDTVTARMQGKVDGAATAPAAGTLAPARKVDVGTVAAIGVAIGGIGAMVAGVLAAFFGLGAWMPIGVAALVLMISGPSMILAWLKLRQRNLGPLLDAGGWAVNGRARINVPFGRALTKRAVLPAGAQRTGSDPFPERSFGRRFLLTFAVLVVIAVSWYLGKLDRYLPKAARSVSVMGDNAPAALR